MAENLVDTAINITICGLSIVFGTLILLVIVISVFGLIMGKINGVSARNKATKTEKVKAPAAPAPTASAAVQSVAAQSAAVSDDDELIAVISAAVAASYAGSGKTFAVRNVRPSAGARSVWAAAGVARNTRAF